MTAKKQMTMVARLMRPIYQLSKERRAAKNCEMWWGCVFASVTEEDTLANCTISRYLARQPIPQKYIQYYADWGSVSPKLIDDITGCLNTYYKDNQLLADVYNILITYACNTDPVDQLRLLPSVIPSYPSRDETAHLWAVLLMYAMTMDACWDLYH